jgi:hypothetical protein
MRAVHKWRFIERMIADAPEHKGVYVLWDGGKALAVGCALGGADTIRSRLFLHRAHASNISHYSWQLCVDPKRRKAEIERELGLVDSSVQEA